MDSVSTLTKLLDSFDFSSVNSTETSSAIDAVVKFLNKAESHLANTLTSHNTSTSSAKSNDANDTTSTALPPSYECSPTIPGTPHPIDSLVDYRDNALEPSLLGQLKAELKDKNKIVYSPSARTVNSPDIALFGELPYVYNSLSKHVKPTPFTRSDTLFRVLDTVNSKLGCNFNSILINKYRNKNVCLPWHKDNESIVDENSPIASLSVGCTRRIRISDKNSDTNWQSSEWLEQKLHDNSIFVMKPGLQTRHYHMIDKGAEDAVPKEHGVRFSLTFRRLKQPGPPASQPTLPTTERPAPKPVLLEQTPSPVPELSALELSSEIQPAQPAATETQPAAIAPIGALSPPQESSQELQTNSHLNCANTLVFGSSLTKGLVSDTLSKRGKTFKVFTRGGANVERVIRMVKDAVAKKEVCTSCVQSIFLVVGGNDAQNIKEDPYNFRADSGMEKLKDSYRKLIYVINSNFPAIRINIMSLIPRKLKNGWHAHRVFYINDFLENLCSNENSNIYFIPMFTKFLVRKDIYYNHGQVILNPKLFTKDGIHFTDIGSSVLAKSLIAVANDPHY